MLRYLLVCESAEKSQVERLPLLFWKPVQGGTHNSPLLPEEWFFRRFRIKIRRQARLCRRPFRDFFQALPLTQPVNGLVTHDHHRP